MKNKILNAIAPAAGALLLAGLVHKKDKKVISERKEVIDKNDEILNMLAVWIKNNQAGKSLLKYFDDKGYSKVAIYGMGVAGRLLYDELKDSHIKVSYAIDKKADAMREIFDVFTLEDELPETDVIVVTAIHYFDDIEDQLLDKVSCPVASLKDIIYGL